jgi:NAD(P)-dependent dehydrogenase (short-subunit alcohol dehydrogenase family)
VTELPPDLKGIRALVTGGTSGLGFAMSQALAEAGARVALTGRAEQRVQDAVTRIARGDQATGLVMDVRDEQSVTTGVDRALTRLGGIDVLVNNAGIGMRTVNPHFMTEPIGFWQVSPDGFRDLLTTNVVGYFLVARAVVPHMLEAGHGKIVNISVSETTMRRRGFTPYGPSRAATEALSHIMAADLAGTGGRAGGLARPGDHGSAGCLARLPGLRRPYRSAHRRDRVRRLSHDSTITAPPSHRVMARTNR